MWRLGHCEDFDGAYVRRASPDDRGQASCNRRGAGLGRHEGFQVAEKAELLTLVCEVVGVDAHERNPVNDIGKAAVKAQMHELRVPRNLAIEAHNHKELKTVRRGLHRLNGKIRRFTV